MAYLKINGFHTSNTGRSQGIGNFLRAVDGAGVPFFAYCANGTTSLLDAQDIIRSSDTAHHAAYHRTDAPNWEISSDFMNNPETAKEAALKYWEYFRDRWPPELDPSIVFAESLKELPQEKDWANWNGHFCYHTALMALNDGYKWCGPGFDNTAEVGGIWDNPGMLKFLNLCQKYPNKLAITLHEFSASLENIHTEETQPSTLLHQLIQVCKQNNIDPPMIFFTRWGWTNHDVPKPDLAMSHILQAGEIYAQYPSIKGAAIWALDGGWGKLARHSAKLVEPLKNLLIETRYPDPIPEVAAPEKKVPEDQHLEYSREYLVAPQDASLAEWLAICQAAYSQKQTVGFSLDDAGIGNLARKTAILYDIPDDKRQELIDWFDENYPHTNVLFRNRPAVSNN